MRTVVVVVLAATLGWTSTAAAAPARVALDDANPTLETAGGGWTTSLGFTNLTDGPASVTTAQPGSGCQLQLGESPSQHSVELRAARHSDVKVTANSACLNKTHMLAFTVTAGGTSFPITAKPEAKTPPDWNQLWAFGAALLVLLILAYILWADWNVANESFWQSMPHLADTWSFKDSWVSNVTVGGSLLTGVLGSADVVKSFLGDKADAAVALATVGAAISVALVGAGGIVLLTAKTRDGKFTVGGVLLASATTLSGALGELWTVYQSGKNLPLGDLADGLLPIVLFAIALLLVYAARSLLTLLDSGTTPPPPVDPLLPPLSEPMFAASMIVAAIEHSGEAAEVEEAVARLRDANVKAGLATLKDKPDIDDEQLDSFLAILHEAKPDLPVSEALGGVSSLLAGWSPHTDADQTQETLSHFDQGKVSAAVSALAAVHHRIDEPKARAAMAEILSDKPIAAAQSPQFTRPRAALL